MISIKTNSGEMPDIPKALKRKAPKGAKPPISVAPSERKLLSPSEAMALEAEASKPTNLPKNIEPAGQAILDAARASKKAAKIVKAPKAVKPSRDGLITVASIATEYGLIPREARGLLRAAKIAKPSVGWAYDAKDAALTVVRDVLKAGKAAPSDKKLKRAAKDSGALTLGKKKALPSDGVWSGKGKKAKAAAPKAPKAAKVVARAEAKKAVKVVGKKAIVKVAEGKKAL